MTLQEEYYCRHGLSDVPLINYVTNGNLLLRTTGKFAGHKTTYVLMTIQWKEGHSGPGMFHINYSISEYKRVARGVSWFSSIVDREMKLDWDEYIGYVTHWSRTINMQPVVDPKEVQVVAWEIMLPCVKEWLWEQSDPDFRRMIWKSVDADTSFESRLESQEDCLHYINEAFPHVVKTYKCEVLSRLDDYCYWLGKLIYWQKGNLPTCLDPTSNII